MFDERFWLAIAFLAFVLLLIRYVLPIIIAQIDSKSKQIAKDLADAKEAKEKAELLFAEVEKRYKEASLFAENLIKDSSSQAQKYFDEVMKNAEEEIAKKMTAAEVRIKQEKENAVREIKLKIVNLALNEVRNDAKNIDQNQSNSLIDRAVSDINKIIG